MKLFDDDKWWPDGEPVLKYILNGIIADDKPFKDCIISNPYSLMKFKEVIALNNYIKNKSDFIFFTNSEDQFLNDQVLIDFEEEILIIILSAEIKEIIFNPILECYLVFLLQGNKETNFYSAGVCKKIDGMSKFNFLFANDKPPNLKIERQINNNDDY